MGGSHTSSGKVKSILKILGEFYPDAECSLNFHDPLQLLISTILSAQCTDERVNKVTPALFEKYRSAGEFADAPIEELEHYIKSTGFYHNKALAIKESCKILANRFNGQVPQDLEDTGRTARNRTKNGKCSIGKCFRHSGTCRRYARCASVGKAWSDPSKGPGQNRAGPDGPYTEGEMDQILSSVDPAWQSNLHRPEAEMFHLPFASSLRLRAG